MNRLSFSLVCVLNLCVAKPTLAQANDVRTEAEVLFQDARRLMQENQFAAARLKLERSQALEPRVGTLLNLAFCDENLGQLKAAWLEYTRAAELARRDKPDSVAFAQDKAERIAAQLSRVTVRVSNPSTPPRVELDGVLLSSDTLGTPLVIEPGRHRLDAAAPERESWHLELDLVAGAARDVQIPELRGLNVDSTKTSGVPAHVYVVGGVAVGAWVGTVVTAFMAHGRYRHFNDINNNPAYSYEARLDAREDARALQFWNLGFLGGALIGTGATILLYSQARPEPSAPSAGPNAQPVQRAQTTPALHLTPWFSAQGGGLGLSGVLQ
ncbi:MAG TPA: hypothetical protein VMF89_09380 [Polyangiales bacterium]|nr:hypothetical protein [Polyangiales bacterium]